MVKISDLKKLCYRSYSFDLNDYYQMISHGQGGLFFDIPEMVGNMGLKTFSSALCINTRYPTQLTLANTISVK